MWFESGLNEFPIEIVHCHICISNDQWKCHVFIFVIYFKDLMLASISIFKDGCWKFNHTLVLVWILNFNKYNYCSRRQNKLYAETVNYSSALVFRLELFPKDFNLQTI